MSSDVPWTALVVLTALGVLAGVYLWLYDQGGHR